MKSVIERGLKVAAGRSFRTLGPLRPCHWGSELDYPGRTS